METKTCEAKDLLRIITSEKEKVTFKRKLQINHIPLWLIFIVVTVRVFETPKVMILPWVVKNTKGQ